MNFQPNELFNQMALFYSQNKSEVNPDNGRKALVKIANQGSSRSGKTYSAIQFIYTFCNHNLNKGLYIAVLRETLVDCRKYTYKDFIECFKMMGVYENCEITEYPNPRIKLYGNTIEFMGLPEPNKQPPRTDICFFNEIVEVNDKQRVNGLLMRCEKLAIFDWNPSYTDHWIFGMESEFNTLFTRTSYLDNKHLSDNIVSNIESYCPWHFDDCHMEIRNGFYVRVWDKPEKPDNCKPEDAHLYRRDNETNIKAGTANKWYWLVYGEGVPAAKEGAIFDPDWIDEFPETGMDSVNLSLDFGYTCFSGDTLITTDKGDVPIRDVRAGDFVLTSEGYHKVLSLNENGTDKVLEKNIRFDFGYRKIISTFDHKFKTDKGWKLFKDLQEGDKLVLHATSTECATTAILTDNTRNTSSEALVKKSFIEKFGKRIMEKYQKVSTYITSTGTPSIMKSRTLRSSQTRSTAKYTSPLMATSVKMASRQRIGLIGGLKLIWSYKLLEKSVNPVGRPLLRQTLIKSIAPLNAITNISTRLMSLTRTTFVHGAEELSEETNTLNRKLARKPVPYHTQEITGVENLSEYETEVYDLTVEGVYDYFANGILVHNCDPSVLTRVGVNVHSKDAFMEALTYQATKDVDTLFDLISPQIEKEIRRRRVEANGEEWYVKLKSLEEKLEVLERAEYNISCDLKEFDLDTDADFQKVSAEIKAVEGQIEEHLGKGLEIAQVVIACDSADRYKDIQFVRDLNSISLQRGLGWQFVKVKKPSITVRIALMHRFRLHIVRDVNVQREAQNYCYQVIEGRQTNIPIDNFNHFWDSVGYCFWYFYRWLINI